MNYLLQSRLHKESAVSLEQQAMEEEAEEEQGAGNYQPLATHEGKTKLVPLYQLSNFNAYLSPTYTNM